jgi:hypothetical protein
MGGRGRLLDGKGSQKSKCKEQNYNAKIKKGKK